MNRRQLLVATGFGLTPLVSGCLDGGARSDDTKAERSNDERDDTSTSNVRDAHEIGDTVRTDVGDVTVEAVTVQKSVIDRGVFRILHRADGVQYLLVEVGDDPPDFVPVLDGEIHEPAEQYHPTGPDVAYILGVDVEDVTSDETAAIALERDPDVRWDLPAPVIDRLARRPNIRVLDAEVVERDGASALRIELENTGDRSGVFRGIVLSPVGADLDDGIRIDVPKGETVTETVQNPVIEDWGSDYEIGAVDPEQRTFGEGG